MISGEQFQRIADISFVNPEFYRNRSHLPAIVKRQITCMPQDLKMIYKTHPSEIKKYKVIWIYTHFVHEFLERFGSELTSDHVLITGNSDDHVTEKLIEKHKPKFKVWFCQNKDYINPKLRTIPIGLANSQWEHGNQEMIKGVRDENIEKDLLVYKNFDLGTAPIPRHECNNITRDNGIPMYMNRSNKEYWRMLARSAFAISPRGNGIDCHRIWECLYLRTVPVLIDHPCFSDFKHLPILFINDWNEVTIDFLREQYGKFKDMFNEPIKELDIKYWEDEIRSYVS